MNVLSSPSHVNRSSYNVIPLEQRTEFSSTVGELLPIYYDILNPGEKVTINNILRTRTMELNSAAFCHLTEHIDWFAVPLSQIYKPFESMQFGIKDFHSNFYGEPTLNGRVDYPTIDSSAFNDYFKTLATRVDPYFPSLKGTSMRLMELLDIPLHKYGYKVDGQQSESRIQMPMNFAFWLLASYQKIYMDYFRLSDRELNNPLVYNYDSYWQGGNVASTGALAALFTLRYRPWNKDFFTHLYTSPLMGTESIGAWNVSTPGQSPLTNMFSQWLTGMNGVDVDLHSPSYGGSDIDEIHSIDSDRATPTAISVYDDFVSHVRGGISPDNIRTSFAVEKLLEITRRAGKHVDQQLLAHFGVKVSPKVSGEVEHIYHCSNDIMIGDVIATAASDANAFGQVGGKGYGSGNGKFKWTNDYTCPVVLMAIYSCNPEVDYAVTGLGRLNTYNQNSDFFHDEFDNLGMQPQFTYQRNLVVAPEDFAQNYQIPGWQYKWMELKCKSNRTTGALARSLYFWTTRRNILDSNTNLSSFLVNPSFLNPIMQKDYDFGASFDWDTDTVEPTEFTGVTASSLFDSDPLIHEFFVHCNKATRMSTFSLPSL